MSPKDYAGLQFSIWGATTLISPDPNTTLILALVCGIWAYIMFQERRRV